MSKATSEHPKPMPWTFFPLLILTFLACCVEIDLSVPSFPAMAQFFNVSEGTIQLTIAYNFLGFCLAGVLYGPLSESYGRRNVMIIGNAFLMIGALGCVYAPSINFLLTTRFVQGVGAVTSAVLVFAMIADAYQGEKATRLIGVMNCVLTIFMAGAPIAGGFLFEAVGWRGSYSVVAGLCLVSWICMVFLLPETKIGRDPLVPRKIIKDYAGLFTDTQFLSASLVPSLQCAAYMAFIACGAFLYMETFELPVVSYAFHQGSIIVSFSVVSLLAGKIAEKMGTRNAIIKGTAVSIAGAIALVILSLVDPYSPYLTTLFMIVYAVGVAITYPVIFASSMEIFPDIKGTASSAIMGVRGLLCSLFVGITGYFYNGEPIRVFSVILGIVVLYTLLTLKVLQSEQFVEPVTA